MASIVICVFIFLSVVFDMVGVATASADINTFIRWNKQQIRGSTVGLKLCEHSEKVCSFCGDVVGDICSTLCGAAGACIVVTLTHNMINSNIIIIISITSSALIAGITIFFKALMKEYALKNSDKILLKLGIFLEKTLFREKKKKV